MTRILVVHHTTSPALHTLHEAAISGLAQPGLEGVEIVSRPALGANVTDVLESDGIVLGTPANIGYISGALKHFFDQIYYPCLSETAGRPYAAYVHGNEDVAGALRAIEVITTGLSWRRVAPPLVVIGTPAREDSTACGEIAALVAAHALGLVG